MPQSSAPMPISGKAKDSSDDSSSEEEGRIKVSPNKHESKVGKNIFIDDEDSDEIIGWED